MEDQDMRVLTAKRQVRRGFESEADRCNARDIHPDTALRVALYAVRERAGEPKFRPIRDMDEYEAARAEMIAHPPRDKPRKNHEH